MSWQIENEKFILTDQCRIKLVKYTVQAFDNIPKIDHPVILDIGCGTGVPTIALLDIIKDGSIIAVDQDMDSLNWFRQKLYKLDNKNRIKLIQASFYETEKYQQNFDLILAEGILHIVDFKPGFLVLKEMLKENGYMIIHDENRAVQEKKKIFKSNGFEIIDSFILDRNIWWDSYFKLLKLEIEKTGQDKLFSQELKYIQEFEKSPEKFESVYFVLKKSINKAK